MGAGREREGQVSIYIEKIYRANFGEKLLGAGHERGGKVCIHIEFCERASVDDKACGSRPARHAQMPWQRNRLGCRLELRLLVHRHNLSTTICIQLVHLLPECLLATSLRDSDDRDSCQGHLGGLQKRKPSLRDSDDRDACQGQLGGLPKRKPSLRDSDDRDVCQGQLGGVHEL